MAETKIKTGNIYSNTNPYVLREATVDDLGGVKAHSTTELDTQAVNIDPEGFLKTKAYKAGTGINITEDGTINATGGGSSGGVSQEYVDQQVATKQDKLVSGVNIATINNQDITKGGNITIEGSGGGATPEQIAQIETNKNDITNLKAGKLDANKLATINNQRLDQGGNINISGGSLNLLQEAKLLATRNQYQLCNQNLPLKDEKNVDLILFAGQSNSCGRAELTDASTPLDVFVQVDENIGFDVSNGGAGGKKPIIEPISANSSTGYGYIPAFINAYHKTTNRVVCACYSSLGATMLNKFLPYTYDEEGHKLPETPGTQFGGMCNVINWSKGSPHLKNKLGHIYMVWCQGESDGDYYGTNNPKCNIIEKGLKTFRQKVDYYKTSFTDMFNALREKTGVEKVFIIRIGHQNLSKPNIKPETKFNYLPIIQAQNELGQENPDIVIVSTIFAGAQFFEENNGIKRNLMRDEWHYLPEGYVRAGLEAGVNAGIFVNSQYVIKPILAEYNQVYLDAVPGFTEFDNIYYENPIDKYLYNPSRIDMQFMLNLVQDKVNSITCSPKETSIKPGDTVQIETIFSPGNVSNKALTYSSSAPSIASVSESGLITAKDSLGDAIITVTSKDNILATDTITVHVQAKVTNISSITIQENSIELDKGKTKQLTFSVEPKENNDILQWKVEPGAVATVSLTGLVTANDYGDAIITAYSKNNPAIKDTCAIHVSSSTPEPVNKPLTVSSTGKNEVGQVLDIIVKSENTLINDATLSIITGNDKASLSGNKLTLNKAGQVIVQATKIGYTTGTLTILVEDKPIIPTEDVVLELDFTNKSAEDYIVEGKLKKVNTSDILPKYQSGKGLVFDESTNMPNGIQLVTPVATPTTFQVEMECTLPDAPDGEAAATQIKNKYRSFAIITGSKVATEPNTTDFAPAVYTMPNGTLEYRYQANKANKIVYGGTVGQSNQIFLYDEQPHSYKLLINKTDKAYPHKHEAYRDDKLIAYTYTVIPEVVGNFEYIAGASSGYLWGSQFAWQPKSILKKIKITKLEK